MHFALFSPVTAVQLAKRCVLFALEHHTEVMSQFETEDYYNLMGRMVPHLRSSLHEDVGKQAISKPSE
jgi:hypothetical protein